jgi:hypothetical protein
MQTTIRRNTLRYSALRGLTPTYELAGLRSVSFVCFSDPEAQQAILLLVLEQFVLCLAAVGWDILAHGVFVRFGEQHLADPHVLYFGGQLDDRGRTAQAAKIDETMMIHGVRSPL